MTDGPRGTGRLVGHSRPRTRFERRSQNGDRMTLRAALLVLALCAPTPSASTDPAAVVAASVDAYNARDFDAFAATLAADVQLFEFPDTPLYPTTADALAAYRGLFRQAADLRADVTSRVVQGQYVIDQETIHGMPGKGPTKGVAIYKVEDGRIVAIWFLE